MSRPLESLLRRAPSGESGWVDTFRSDALARFVEQGLPTRRLESWKGTSLAKLDALEFARVGPGPGRMDVPMPPDGLVFVDGRFDAEASQLDDLPAGVRVDSLADTLANDPDVLKGRLGDLADVKRHALVALQTAFVEDGVVVVVDAGVRATRPIRMRFVSTTHDDGASAAFPRVLVVLGENSEATLVQDHVSVGAAPGLTACVAELHLAAGARLETVQIQEESAERIHFTSVFARLGRDARLDAHVYTLGTGLVRSELAVELTEPGADANLNGLFVGRDDAHIDHFTTVDHVAEGCSSVEEYRGVLGDRAEGVFRGRVIVRPGAQRTDARQSNPNLLLSDSASIDSKPQLEIYADDIRASHGSTIGQLDPDALFYLRARGVDLPTARLLLTGAFALGVVDRITNEEVRQATGTRIDSILSTLARESARESDAPGPETKR